MKILITGATGSLGSALVRHFTEKGNEVIALGRSKNAPVELLKIAEYRHGDITEKIELPEADICINAAALSGDSGSKKEFIRVNVDGTRNLMNSLKKIPVLIHISSSSVYLPSSNPIKEEDTFLSNKLSHYGFSKYLSEKAVVEKFFGSRCMIARPRALYGPGDLQIIPRMLRLVKRDNLVLPGKMEINVSMTHYRNLIRSIELFIESGKSGINIYNVADAKKYILADVVRLLTCKLYGKSLPEKKIPEFLIKLFGKLYIGGMTPLLARSITNDMLLDITKIEKELNYHPVYDFENTIDETVSWINAIGGASKIITQDKNLIWK